jgi:hypothetical protein
VSDEDGSSSGRISSPRSPPPTNGAGYWLAQVDGSVTGFGGAPVYDSL